MKEIEREGATRQEKLENLFWKISQQSRFKTPNELYAINPGTILQAGGWVDLSGIEARTRPGSGIIKLDLDNYDRPIRQFLGMDKILVVGRESTIRLSALTDPEGMSVVTVEGVWMTVSTVDIPAFRAGNYDKCRMLATFD